MLTRSLFSSSLINKNKKLKCHHNRRSSSGWKSRYSKYQKRRFGGDAGSFGEKRSSSAAVGAAFFVGLAFGTMSYLYSYVADEEPQVEEKVHVDYDYDYLNSTEQERLEKILENKEYALRVHSEMRQNDESQVPIYRIVITGGPCGGKTTALASISDRLQSYGFRVFRVPEAATLIIMGTMIFPPNIRDPSKRLSFEASLVKTKIALEDIFYEIARSQSEPCVILCDRGTMDTAAYMNKDDWEILLDEHSWNVVTIRDRRYDAIIHMVTAAIGAEKFYSLENNNARTESINDARDLDFKVLNAWVGHPHIKIIDNSTGFQDKIRRVEEQICQIVGAPRPTAQTRKFILDNEVSRELMTKLQNLKCEAFEVEQTYLAGAVEEGYNFLRKRGQNGMYTYTHSVFRTPKDSEEFVILERSITGREYVELLKQQDTARIPVVKKIQCFLWNNMYYEISTFLQPDIKLTVLNLQTENPTIPIEFPWFINVKGEVSGLDVFSSHQIAKNFNVSNPHLNLNWKQNQEMFESYNKNKRRKQEMKKKEEMKIIEQIRNHTD